MPNDGVIQTYGYDPHYIPPVKIGCRFIGNSSKNTAQEAVDDYSFYVNVTLIAEPFTPDGVGEGRIKFAVYKKVQE